MAAEVDIRMPSDRTPNPLRELGRRLMIGVVLTCLVTLGTYLERDGYRDAADNSVSLLDALYYTTVSITTTGYGDVVPVSDAARLFTTFIVTPARIVFLVLLVGTSVELITLASRSLIREGNWRRRVRDHVVICGFGVKGRTALDSLREQDTPSERVVVIDPNEDAIAEAARLGCVGILGEATRNELLEAARVDRASCVIVAPNRDDSGVLITLSVRQLNPTVRIVAAVRELENAPLMRGSGADVVLTSSGSTGRMLGLGAVTPHYVQVLEELLETGTGFDLIERDVDASQSGPVAEHRRDRELIVAVFRNDELVVRNPDGSFVLEPGDQLVSVGVADAARNATV